MSAGALQSKKIRHVLAFLFIFRFLYLTIKTLTLVHLLKCVLIVNRDGS